MGENKVNEYKGKRASVRATGEKDNPTERQRAYRSDEERETRWNQRENIVHVPPIRLSGAGGSPERHKQIEARVSVK